MKQYLDLLKDVMDNGVYKESRTGVGTYSVFGRQMRFDLNAGFPLVTTKRTHLKSIIHELLWFIRGETNIQYLNDRGVSIWDEWATEKGELGPVYGAQWRNWQQGIDTNALLDLLDPAKRNGLSVEDSLRNLLRENIPTGIDQLSDLIANLKARPHSRRHIVSAWNPAFLPDETISPQENAEAGKMALPPCHVMFQFNVRQIPIKTRIQRLAKIGINVKLFPFETAGYGEHLARLEAENGLPTNHTVLDCQLYQRSVDTCLGLPFNIASYALLTMMVAEVCGYGYGEFVWTGGDVHIYENHMEGAKEQIKREPKKLPKMIIAKRDNVTDYQYGDFVMVGYDAHDHIPFPIAV